MKTSRLFLLPILFTFFYGFFGLSAKQACAAGVKDAQVLGYVNNCAAAMPFEPVTATCGSQTLTVQTGSTGGDNGKYSITFHNAGCKKGSTVSVTSAGHTETGTIGNYFFFTNIGEVNIQTGTGCETTSVPEFGMLEKLIAIFASAGIFFYLRSRNSVNKA